MTISITRQTVVAAAKSLLGTPFVHQGRNAAGVDCVGLLVRLGGLIDYPFPIHDLDAYNRTPSASKLKEMLLKNLDEIPLDEVKAGDIYLMRVGGLKPRHTSIRSSDTLDPVHNKFPMMIHALNRGRTDSRVVEHRIKDWERNFVMGFRIRGLQN